MSKTEVYELTELLNCYYFTYIPSVSIIFDSIPIGIFASYLVHWHGKTTRKDGWMWKTIEEAEKETGLSRYQQDRAISALASHGVLEIQRKESRGRRHFKLDIDKLYFLLDSHKNDFNLKKRK